MLAAALRAGVRAVVVTSSCAAVTAQHPDRVGKGAPAYLWSEKDWNLDATVDDGPYRLSKRLAEEAAWAFHAAHPSLGVVALNPAFVLGPPVLARRAGESTEFIARLLDGTHVLGLPDERAFGIVDVRDLAAAHVAAMRKAVAPGATPADVVGKRFVLSSRLSYTALDLADALRVHFEVDAYWKGGGQDAREPGDALLRPARFPLPQGLLPGAQFASSRKLYDHGRAERVLGTTFRPPAESAVDMAEALLALGVVDRDAVHAAARAHFVEKFGDHEEL